RDYFFGLELPDSKNIFRRSKIKTIMRNEHIKKELIGVKADVGSGGFVKLLDVMGDDAAVVEAARISTTDEQKTSKEDERTIWYMMEHQHGTPFEMCELKFHVRMTLETMRQWVRHRTASINEYSQRYREAINECESVMPGEWRVQSKSNRQGSDGFLDVEIGEILSAEQAESQIKAREVYEGRLDKGVAKEQARRDLPLSTYTEIYWKIDLRNLLHFLHLRMHVDAQLEIRQFATSMYETFVKPLFPVTCAAWENFVRDAVTFSAQEVAFLKRLIAGLAYQRVDISEVGTVPNTEYHINETLQESALIDENGNISPRKRKALENKLALIGIR
nr:FAD-dependent thymidylate synthase [Pyrinomonadaceae bacterium]